ncbi:hypothetical protein [Aeromicrobium sp.]|uniref:hypothetical protein n=1 Tax=Aeromicrobium sp. TaxID=1871063 RepID=UPI002FC681BB
MKNSILTAEQAAWLARTMDRNRSIYSGWFMGPEDDAEKQEDGEGADDTEADGKDDKSDADKDWKAEFEAQQRINRNLERRTRKDAATIATLSGKKPESGSKDKPDADDKPDVDKIREEAKAEAAREVLTGRVEDKIEAKARAFADPEDAVAVLLRTHDIEDFIDGGKPDVDAIADALKELGEKKPHLLAQGGQRFQGGADGGARKETPQRPKDLGEAVARHYDNKG